MLHDCPYCECTPEVRLPEGCVCGLDGSWGDPLNVPAVCNSYVGDNNDPCFRKGCEHDRACHKEVTTP